MAFSRGHSMYYKEIPSPSLKIAGLIIRRKDENTPLSFHQPLTYKQEDYEVLLRRWQTPPFQRHLSVLSGPLVQGQVPEVTLMKECYGWTSNLAAKAGMKKAKGVKGLRAVFLASCGGGTQVDQETSNPLEQCVILSYVVPTNRKNSTVIDHYPDNTIFPKFYCLQSLLWKMYHKRIAIHPYTKQLLSNLDHWLREQHAVPGAIGSLFTYSLTKKCKMAVFNPLFQLHLEEETKQRISSITTPKKQSLKDNKLNSTPVGFGIPRDISFDLSLLTFKEEENEEEEDGEGNQIVPEEADPGEVGWLDKTEDLVDRVVINPFFGQGVTVNFNKLQNVASATPDSKPQGENQWADKYPLHKFACEGDVTGVQEALEGGIEVDEKDVDHWSALHYASWYGSLDVVGYLVESAKAFVNIKSESGSTPLHLAAHQGHSHIVAYLLQRGKADKSIKDTEGHTALEVCLASKKEDWKGCAEALKEKHASDIIVEKYKLPSHISKSVLARDVPETTPELARRIKIAEEKLKTQSCRIDIGNGSHVIIDLKDGPDTVGGEMINTILEKLAIKEEYNKQFALWATSPSLEIQLGDRDKPMDIVKRWNKLVQQIGGDVPRNREIPQLFIRPNVFYTSDKDKRVSDLKALEIKFLDCQRHVVCGNYPCTLAEAIYLAGISLQINHGDFNESLHSPGSLNSELKSILPVWLYNNQKQMPEIEKKVVAQYAKISESKNRNLEILYREYKKFCSHWPFYGSFFFPIQCTNKPARLSALQGHTLTLGINTKCITIISKEPCRLVQQYPIDGLDWDASSARMELQITVHNTGDVAIFKTKRLGLLKTVLQKFINIRRSFSDTL